MMKRDLAGLASHYGCESRDKRSYKNAKTSRVGDSL